MKSINIVEFQNILKTAGASSGVCCIDVRTPAEYRAEHIVGVKNMPLDQIKKHADQLDQYDTVYVQCLSGGRSCQAIEKIQGIKPELINVEGGITAWKEAGLPVKLGGSTLPIMRQVMIVAGVLVLTGVGLSLLVSESFIWLSAFVGAGLLFSGVSGWCGMALLLGKMPWNR